ncbi:hypothetical protein [Salinimicrobium flavum]|uniref:Uncharacterized protein n=1 Tax=Salinimicrobium flavum TaxID=1737065 RepID=A0ABW5ISP9_9FLAO
MENIEPNRDELIRGIKEILSKNRCSLSVEDEKLLSQTISYLEKSKDPEKSLDLATTAKVFELLLRFFLDNSDNFF